MMMRLNSFITTAHVSWYRRCLSFLKMMLSYIEPLSLLGGPLYLALSFHASVFLYVCLSLCDIFFFLELTHFFSDFLHGDKVQQ